MNQRILFAVPAAICAALLGFAYYLQFGKGIEPCPLCLVQRGWYYGVLAFCVAGALHGPGRVGTALYAGGAMLFAIGGIATAGRNVWLQHLPPDKVPQCGPDLYFMLDNLPLGQTLQRLVQGTGECAQVDWAFLGLSIAEWSLGWFVLLALYAAWLMLGARVPRAWARASA